MTAVSADPANKAKNAAAAIKASAKKAATKGVSGASLAAAEVLSDYLDTRVTVQAGTGKGKIVIEYSGNEDLQRIVDLIEG